MLATQQAKLRLIVYSPKTVTLDGFRGDSVPCPLFKVFDKAGGPPLIRIPIESSIFLDSIRLKGVGKDTDFAIWMHRRCSSDCAGI
ncbi:hypothetical protein [Deinococcus wulumuqiensis]|uniref:hypothetical protein n=1 Tax=Deinococcus wulumuqiensis TaxID=980427 RepID=UPI00242D08CC|nr:hypothetical protein [Deinococcus wulumuqiensis]